MEKLIVGARKLGVELNSRQLEQFNIYYQELVHWNRWVNLTTIISYEEVQTKHFLDSLTITLAIKPPPGTRLSLIDVGTGAGLPGIPLKILLPDIKLVLLEATAKKATFLHHVKHQLGLDNTEIVVGRAETVAHEAQYRENFEVSVSRAVAQLNSLVELTLPFCTIGGSFIAQKKGTIDREIGQATRAIEILGGNLREVKRVELEELTNDRYLLVIDKLSPTPQPYPRHPGMPAKRPII
jgi:16S rRNA (guanine527-N7)-methyltransferase